MIHLYYHGGSANHGCEAIVRSTARLLDRPLALWSRAPEEDKRYGLDQIVDLYSDRRNEVDRTSFGFYLAAAETKLFGSEYRMTRELHKTFADSVLPGDICMSIGGDNYCYSGVEDLGYYNRMLKNRRAKTVLWGCSIEPSALTPEVVKDLRRYDLITVRESLSYEGLVKAGVGERTVFCADPAFLLEKTDMPLPDGFTKENTVGVNVSPLAASCGNQVMENYLELVRFILRETKDRVLLIPHVVKESTDDRNTLHQIAEQFDSDRVRIVEDQNCMRLKGLISQCKLFVGARTHATIAAYSTCVPTLVSGYSVKARGIARDLFGTEQNYVVPVQEMKTAQDLTKAYCWIAERRSEISTRLEKTIPEFQKRAASAGEALLGLE